MKFVICLVLTLAALLSEGCGADPNQPPAPVPPAAGLPGTPGAQGAPGTPGAQGLPGTPGVPPAPTVIALPTLTPVPTLVPPVPQLAVEITRSNVMEVSGFVACPASYTATATINVVLESALATGGTTSAVIGVAVPASLPASLLGVPAVPAGSENRAFRFDLTQSPFAGDPRVAANAPVSVAVPPAVPGGAVLARSRVVFLQGVKVLKPHILEATPEYVRGFVGVSTAVTITSIDLQLLGLTQPGDQATVPGFVAIGSSQVVSVATTAPPAWAPAPPTGAPGGGLPGFPGVIPGQLPPVKGLTPGQIGGLPPLALPGTTSVFSAGLTTGSTAAAGLTTGSVAAAGSTTSTTGSTDVTSLTTGAGGITTASTPAAPVTTGVAQGGSPYPYPYPVPPTAAGLPGFRPVWFEIRLQGLDATASAYVQPGRRVAVMASAATFPRAFSRPAVIKPGASTPGLELNFRVLAAGSNCQAAPGASFARDGFELRAMVRAIGFREVGGFAAPGFPLEAVVSVCLPAMPATTRATLTAVRTNAGGLELRISYAPGAVPPTGAGSTVRPWVMIAIPAIQLAGPLTIIEEPTVYAPQ